MYMSSGAEWITLPNTTWSTWSGSIAGALERRLHGRRAQIGGRDVLQAPPVAADSGARGRCDHYLGQAFLLHRDGRAAAPCAPEAYSLASGPIGETGASTTPTAIFRARMRLHLLAAALLCCRSCCFPPAPGGRPARARRALYRDGPSGRYLLDGVWHTRADPGDQGQQAALAEARPPPPGWQRTTVPSAVQRGRLLERELHGHRALVPQGLPGRRRARPLPSGCCASSRSTTARGVAERQAARLPRRRLPAVRAARQERQPRRREPPRRAGGQPPPEVRHPAAVACARSGAFEGGWWNYNGILREVYLRRVDTFDFAAGRLPAEAALPRCAARVDVIVDGGERELAAGARRAITGTLRRAQPALPRQAGPGARRCTLPGPRCGSATRGCGGPSGPTSTRAGCSCATAGGVVQKLHGPHRHPHAAGQPARAHPAERPRREPARREHARGLARRAAPR